ncbi:uncharacterized protein PHACADRAFT_256508 [Phanerochaete carnosa HHB-10118-sp]|uniref:Uncharacterized protein n=1 Tax=Phanerochaete carnosa (strain HHB-10118-sp) TaxID=650164 RepID=K5UZT4_PHACS|nr:uncharacterized protein PHACADRAFT_256508 [Phanerochaete carnosa HHB-10118-sp]EKM55696.1 hypothetical protein PHACADRAFT_256508 [Phanerochaete carnosa HHB-10118-sp]
MTQCLEGTVRKSLGVNFAGETREGGAMFIVDCVVEGIKGSNNVTFTPIASSVEPIGVLRVSLPGETIPLLCASY